MKIWPHPLNVNILWKYHSLYDCFHPSYDKKKRCLGTTAKKKKCKKKTSHIAVKPIERTTCRKTEKSNFENLYDKWQLQWYRQIIIILSDDGPNTTRFQRVSARYGEESVGSGCSPVGGLSRERSRRYGGGGGGRSFSPAPSSTLRPKSDCPWRSNGPAANYFDRFYTPCARAPPSINNNNNNNKYTAGIRYSVVLRLWRRRIM